MVYVLAVVLGLIVAFQCLASEVVGRNIFYLKMGRQPNAGATVLPAILFFPLVAVCIAALLNALVPQYAIWVLSGLFAVFSIYWSISFWILIADFSRMNKS
jgi:TRAP-type mannitol/chloroaromatic compound transport system permease small subunit